MRLDEDVDHVHTPMTTSWYLMYTVLNIQQCLNYNLTKKSWLAKFGFCKVQTIQNLNKMGAILFKTIQKPNTIWKLNAINHSKSERVRYSLGIRAPTVLVPGQEYQKLPPEICTFWAKAVACLAGSGLRQLGRHLAGKFLRQSICERPLHSCTVTWHFLPD